MSAEFDKVWQDLQSHLHTGMVIRNWTVLKGYYGDDFKIDRVSSEAIAVDALKAENIQNVPEENFEAAWERWPEYLSMEYRRKDMLKITRYSKYIISILHWYDEEVSND